MKEMKELVAASKELVSEIGIKLSIGSSGGKKDYVGESYVDGDSVVITQEVSGDPRVMYDGNDIIIVFDDKEYRYSVGDIDVSSINAVVKNNVLTIRVRRCKDAGKDKEDIQKE